MVKPTCTDSSWTVGGGEGVGVGVEAEEEAVDEVALGACGWRKWNRLECCMKLPTDRSGLKKFSGGGGGGGWWLCGGGSRCSQELLPDPLDPRALALQLQDLLFFRELLVMAVPLRYLGLWPA